jgi:hypothetical protein
MTTLPPLTVYPATLEKIVILRNSTFRKRFLVKRGGVPLDLTLSGTIIDADIKNATGTLIGTFTSALPQSGGTPVPGTFDLQLTPAQSLALPLGEDHVTDISITEPGGDRFYYAKATVCVCETVSRNS